MIPLPGKVSLDPDVLLHAYGRGIFPMQDGYRLRWFTNDPRGVLPLDGGFHIPRRFATALRRPREAGRFQVTTNRCFEAVIRSCAHRPQEGTWISEPIVEAYCRLHQLGHAHSVEVWDGQQLAGGLYGVSIGGAFFGESIFSAQPDGGKVALVHLVNLLRTGGYRLLDIQMVTELTAAFGAREIPLQDYLNWLSMALSTEPSTGVWTASGSDSLVTGWAGDSPGESSTR
jgi:leucyl/phenylalanyl-tRNA--protein transferase